MKLAITNYEILITDGEIASLLSMSRSWVRKERFNRRHGLQHTFDLDPVMVASRPRYRRSDVIAWIQHLSASNDNSQEPSQTSESHQCSIFDAGESDERIVNCKAELQAGEVNHG